VIDDSTLSNPAAVANWQHEVPYPYLGRGKPPSYSLFTSQTS